MLKIKVGLAEAYLDFAIVDDENRLLALSFFDRAATKVRSMNANLEANRIYVGDLYCNGFAEKYKGYLNFVPYGRDRITSCLSMARGVINTKYVITSREMAIQSLYDYLMVNFRLPLLKDWVPYLLETLEDYRDTSYGKAVSVVKNPVISDDMNRMIELGGIQVKLSDIVVYRIDIPEATLEKVVSNGLREGKIWISKKDQEELRFDNLDSYLEKYSKALLENIDKVIPPYLPASGEITDMAFVNKRLFPQQANAVNGAVNLLSRENYAILNEGMGCGKTIQGIGIVELYHIRKYMKQHPEKTMADIYGDPNAINYRAIVMAPSHLVEKWKEEIESEIIYSQVQILESMEDVMYLHKKGKKAKGKEWYILSKEFIKLGSQLSPIPTMVRLKRANLEVCYDCKQNNIITYKKFQGRGKCPKCGGKKWEMYQGGSVTEGLICPKCSELLLSNQMKISGTSLDKLDEYVLHTYDFISHNSKNCKCYHCGTPLWGCDVKNTKILFGDNKTPKKMWQKFIYKPTKTSKTKKAAWFLNGDSAGKEFLMNDRGLKSTDIEPSTSEGARKFAPATYMQKYMKGFFDFCILDEAHKYENGGTAQTHAAHVLIKCSKKHLALTGTISNGYAKNLFYLFWMLFPEKMVKDGYKYSDVAEFSKKYGNVETIYEYDGDGFDDYNSQSRGRQLVGPAIKPGISPVLYIKYLMGSGVQLDLDDLSDFLPPLTEKVEIVPLELNLAASYNAVIGNLKKCIHTDEGKGALWKMLRFGLFYTDKPYGRSNIMSSYNDTCLAKVVDHSDMISNGKLLFKEKRLIERVSEEVSEGRNVFVFCECTSNKEAYMPSRLKGILEDNIPELRNKVFILETTTVSASKREAFIHKKAAEGIKIFICNPALVETGLDFIWKENGQIMNFPTIMFYQMTYRLATLWQASRRHYRLIQDKECRTFYFASDKTLQVETLRLMGLKQQAVAAIQGKFSSGGLAAMAQGVDARVLLAQKLQDGTAGSSEGIEEMFDDINHRAALKSDIYTNCKPMFIVSEILGEEILTDVESVEVNTDMDIIDVDAVTEVYESESNFSDDTFDFVFDDIFGIAFDDSDVQGIDKKKKKKNKKRKEEQISLFDFC